MQKVIIMMSVMAFLLPVGFMVALNWDNIAPASEPEAKPQGKLIYFFSPS